MGDYNKSTRYRVQARLVLKASQDPVQNRIQAAGPHKKLAELHSQALLRSDLGLPVEHWTMLFPIKHPYHAANTNDAHLKG